MERINRKEGINTLTFIVKKTKQNIFTKNEKATFFPSFGVEGRKPKHIYKKLKTIHYE